ncbi:MAG: AAA family ATPase [Chloroflexi bacterium]|nr:AAA family ATPase [Chloroflexota bacterium]
MRFDKIDAPAFGPLQDSLELAPGMNVIYGPNEAGKSSWHAALYTGLCGIPRGRGHSKALRDFTERHKPWDTRAWEVNAVITLADGRRVELRHDLANRLSSARDTNIARRDYTNEIRHDGAPDGSRWLGLNRQTFLSTACVRQADVLGILNDPAMLQDDMQRAAATAGANSTAAAALLRLEKYRREQVGSQQAPTRPLRRSQAEVRKTQALLSEAKEKHAEYLSRREEVERLEQEVQNAQSSVDAMHAALAEADAAAAQERLRKIKRLSKLFPEGAPHPSPERDSLAEQVATALDRWRSLPELVEPEGETVQEYQTWIEDSERRLAAHQAAVAESEATEARERHSRALELTMLFPDGHPPRTSADEERFAERVRRVLSDFESMRTPSEPVGRTAAEIEEELRAFDTKVNASRTAGARIRLPMLLLSGLTIAGGLVLALLLPDLLMAGVGIIAAGVIGGLISLLLTRPRAQDQLIVDISRQGILQRLNSRREEEYRYEDALHQQSDARSRLLEVAQECDSRTSDQQSGVQILHDWLLAWESFLKRRDDLAPKWDQLQGLLGEDALDDLEVEALHLEEEATRLVSLADIGVLTEARRADITREQLASMERTTNGNIRNWEREQSKRSSDDEEYERTRKETAAAEDRLRKAGEAIGVTGHDVDEVVTTLEEWQSSRARTLAEAKERMDRWDELQNLIAGQSLEEVVNEVESLEQEALESASKVRADVLASTRAQQPTAAELDALIGEANDTQLEHTRASGELSEFARRLPSVPDAEEALADAERIHERLASLDSTLERTIGFLKDAQERVHQDIAPILRQTVLEWLPEVTDGRYVDCRVNPQSLAVDLSGADKRWRNAALLSRGTAEQVYLLLRLALAQHLTREEPCPLILDDAVAACDVQRKQVVLDTLLAISETQDVQVVLFTHEEDVRDWARNRLSSPAHLLRELDRIPSVRD